MIRLTTILLLCVLLSACSKDEPEVNDPEQEQQEQEQEQQEETDGLDFLISVSTSADFIPDNSKFYYFITNANNEVIGDFIELTNGVSQKKIQRPSSFTETQFNLHSLNVYTGPDAKSASIVTYKNVSKLEINLFDDFESDCVRLDDGNVSFNLSNFPDIEYGNISLNNCNVTQLSSPVGGFSSMPFEPNSDILFHLKNTQGQGLYYRIPNVTQNSTHNVTSSNFSTDMRFVTPNFDAAANYVKVTEVSSSNYNYPKQFIYDQSKPAEAPDFTDLNYYLPNDKIDAVYKTYVEYGDPDLSGVYKSVSFRALEGDPDISILNGDVIISDEQNPKQSSYTILGDGDAMLITFFGSSTPVDNTSISSLFHGLYTGENLNIAVFPSIPDALQLMYPNLNESTIFENARFSASANLETYSAVNNFQEYVEMSLKSNVNTYQDLQYSDFKNLRNIFNIQGRYSEEQEPFFDFLNLHR